MEITYTQNLNLGMQLDKTDYVNWDVITQNWQKIDDTAFTGELTIENPFFDINMTKGELKFNQQSAHSGGYQISPTAIFHYNGAWEWCITYRPKFLPSNPVRLLGTEDAFYNNPVIEVQSSGTAMWLGTSRDNSSWTDGIYVASSISGERKMSEPLAVGTEYSFILGFDAERVYVKIIKADTGETIVEYEQETTAPAQHSNQQNKKVILQGTNNDPYFWLAGDIILSKTYYKENGAVLWGNKAYAAKMEEGNER